MTDEEAQDATEFHENSIIEGNRTVGRGRNDIELKYHDMLRLMHYYGVSMVREETSKCSNEVNDIVSELETKHSIEVKNIRSDHKKILSKLTIKVSESLKVKNRLKELSKGMAMCYGTGLSIPHEWVIEYNTLVNNNQ